MAKEVLSVEDLLKMRHVTATKMSPDGRWIAYTLSVPRAADDKAGAAYSELHLVSADGKQHRPFITGKVNVSAIAWQPDGSAISFLRKTEKKVNQVWTIPVNGGEAQTITDAPGGVSAYHWSPNGKQIGYISIPPKSARLKALEKKGYGFTFYEEDMRPRNLHLFDVASGSDEQLTTDMSVWSFEFAPNGKTIAAAMTEKNLIDHRYAFQLIYILDIASKKYKALTSNPRKLGNFVFSPDGKQLAFVAALDQKDHAVSQAFVIPVSGGVSKNLTEPDFPGHVNWVGWKNNNTIMYRAAEGVFNTFNTISLAGKNRKMLSSGHKDRVVYHGAPEMSADFKNAVYIGQTSTHGREVFTHRIGKAPRRLTNSNLWLGDRKLGEQKAVSYKARDGVEVYGLAIYPVGYEAGKTYPMVVIVHGGPESHFSNGWISRYAEPGQVLAGRGYVVFYPNYRASTGYGVKYGAYGYGDAAGVEFEDIADGIDWFIKEGVADKNRVGLGGGSYGGYASAWFSTFYTEKVRAVCMFVGISDLISKRGTTDIPYEELFVHSGKKLEEMWELSLERSPIYYAHKSKTATLIYAGADDPRVHPSQSLEMYRRLKMNDHPAVRLIFYPGEGHGNRKQPGQIDVLHRITDWYDWYVKDAKPLDGPMPPLDISDRYGLDLPE